MDRIKISVPMGGRILTLGKNGPVVTPEITDLNTAEGILREGHKVYFHKVDGTSEELTLDALYILMEAEQMLPTTTPLVGEEKIKKVLTKLGVSYDDDLDDNGTLGGKDNLLKILSRVGTVKTVDSITGVDNMLDTLANWGFSRARLNADDDALAIKINMLLIVSNAFDMPLTEYNLDEYFSEGGWLPEELTSKGVDANGYGVGAAFAIKQKSTEYYGWQVSPYEMERIYALNCTSVYLLGNTDVVFLRGDINQVVSDPKYNVIVIGAEDDNVANWVGDSTLNPELYEADPFAGYTIVYPPRWNT